MNNGVISYRFISNNDEIIFVQMESVTSSVHMDFMTNRKTFSLSSCWLKFLIFFVLLAVRQMLILHMHFKLMHYQFVLFQLEKNNMLCLKS